MIRRKKLSNTTFIAAVAIIFAAFGFAFAQDQPWDPNVSPLPSPTGFVNDYAGVIDTATKQSLESKLTDFKQKTTVEIAVAVVRTTGDRDIFDYSLAVARGWKIGSKNDDNPGALLFIAIDDRKYFTQVSRDLEDELPDALAGNLQRQYLVPEFKKGNYSKGISDTVDAYIRTIEQRASGVATPTPAVGGSEDPPFPYFSAFCCLVIIFVIFLIIWANRGVGGKSRSDRDRWGGGFGGGGGGVLPWIIGSAISNAASSSGSSWGGSSDWGGSSGGSDWGGFGGGGDFGGGGSGGGW
jgi:uncharacterized protein